MNKVKEGLLKLKSSNKRIPEVVCLDVTDPLNVVKSKLDVLVTKLGCIDILINNAGVSFRGEVCSYIFSLFFKSLLKISFFFLSSVFQHLMKFLKK